MIRVAVTFPTAWPQIRRGGERLLHETTAVLHRNGFDGLAISSSPEIVGEVVQEAVRYRFLPQVGVVPPSPRAWWGAFHRFALALHRQLLSEPFDAVVCLHHLDAAAAVLARRRTGRNFRLLFYCVGIPLARAFRRVPLDGLAFRLACREADEVAVLSRFAADLLRRDFGRDGVLLPSPVDLETFRRPAGLPRAERPIILFSGDADEPRKGAVLLARAYAVLRADGTDAVLRYTGRCSEATRGAILESVPPAWRQDIEVLGPGRRDDLPMLYATASVMALPSVWEALGMAFLEALACGTPVVGCRHGGPPDTVTDPAVGTLVDVGPDGSPPAPEAVVSALRRTLALARDPATVGRCRAAAHRMSWDVHGPRLCALVSGRPPAAFLPGEVPQAVPS